MKSGGALKLCLRVFSPVLPNSSFIFQLPALSRLPSLSRLTSGMLPSPELSGNIGILIFYLHDRLASVSMLIDDTGAVQNYYTYDPFGTLFDNQSSTTTVENPYRFAGYFWDDEIAQYDCRARVYDPQLQRSTAGVTVLVD